MRESVVGRPLGGQTRRPQAALSRSFYAFARAVHQYVSMAMLLIALFFAVTGLTLNHPDWFVGEPEVKEYQQQVPGALMSHVLAQRPVAAQPLLTYLVEHHGLVGHPDALEIFTDWDGDELLEGELSQSYQGPGYHASVYVDLTTGEAEVSVRDAGVVAWLNDLHKGRHSGELWSLVIDLSAVLMVLFILSGAVLVIPNRRLGRKLLALAAAGALVTLLLALATR